MRPRISIRVLVRPLVRWSVGPSVRPSVRPSVTLSSKSMKNGHLRILNDIVLDEEEEDEEENEEVEEDELDQDGEEEWLPELLAGVKYRGPSIMVKESQVPK